MLEVYLFGTPEFVFNGKPLDVLPTRKSKSIIAFLIIGYSKIFCRELLAAEFWGDLSDHRARKALNSDLWRIGKTLRNSGINPSQYLISTNETLAFKPSVPYWVDVMAFDHKLCGIHSKDVDITDQSLIKSIEKSLTLYRGDFMEGCYDDWCLVQRETFRAKQLNALEFLFRHHMKKKAWESALKMGQRLLHSDPLMEHIHRGMIRCHYLMGNRPAAVAQYHSCARTLKKEFRTDAGNPARLSFHYQTYAGR